MLTERFVGQIAHEAILGGVRIHRAQTLSAEGRLPCEAVATRSVRMSARAAKWFGWLRIGDVALAIVAYVPLLLTHRTKVGADTKTYLYLDPAKLLAKAPFLWDSSVGLGTVTHQNIGYLFPMGPYYWLAERIGMPDWIAQRIWMGSIIFLAGLGVRYLLRTLHWEGPGVTVACFAYALSPYLLHYIYKHSVILLPFTALPWLVAFCARSLRHPGWKYPALFALVALASGGVNATSLLLILIGPGLWVIHAVFIEREISARAAVAPLVRIGVLTLATSLWWMAGLSLQGRYGIDILRFTETYKTVSNSSSATEVGRSLGYWFFYGVDTLGPWFKAAETLTQSIPAVALSLAVPIVCIACGLWTRFRYRIFFVGLVLAGLVVSVGAFPWDSPTPYGSVFKAFTGTASGLALRSTPRAVPLLALGLAVFLGAGVAAASRLMPARRLVFAGLAVILVMANLSPMFTGRLIDPFLERDADVPGYWHEAGKYLDTGDRRTRALEVPGIEFANYRWGATVDPITPGLTDRDYAARELVPYGSPASANLMNAIDIPFQDRTFDPESYAALMRMMGVGHVILRSDLEYERFRTPRPRTAYRWMEDVAGFGTPTVFGPDTPNKAAPDQPLTDDIELSVPDEAPDPHAVSIYPVEDPLTVIRSVPAAGPIIVSGDGSGLVSAAEAGLLDPERLVVYSGSVTNKAEQLDQLLDQKPSLVITDTNRRAGRRWGATKDNEGYTEPADFNAPADTSDNRLDIFEGRGPKVQTVAEYRGPFTVRASDYGNPFSYTAGDRPVNAIDGDPTSAWRAGAFSNVRGTWIELRSSTRITPGTVRLAQLVTGNNRFITRVRLTFDDGPSIVANLPRTTLTDGEVIDIGNRSFKKLRITVLEADPGDLISYQGLSGVGFSEITIGNLDPVLEVIRPPVDLLDAAGSDADDLDLSFVMRRRNAPPDSGAPDEEHRMLRSIDLPSGRAMTVSGKLRLNSDPPDPITYDPAKGPTQTDATIDELLGVGGATMTSSSRLGTNVAARASKAFDGDDSTAWQAAINAPLPQWVQIATPEPTTGSVSSIVALTDGRHSVPTRIHFELDGKAQPSIELDPVVDGPRGTTSRLEFPEQALDATTVRLVIDAVREVSVPDWLTGRRTVLPVGISSIDAESLESAVTTTVSTLGQCRDDLVTVDGKAVPVRPDMGEDQTDEVRNRRRATAETDGLIDFTQCDPTAVNFEPGSTTVKTADGRSNGINIDLLVLGTDASVSESEAVTPAPKLTVTPTSRVSYDITPSELGSEPYWLVLGQSDNAGWELTAGDVDFGPSVLVNGFSNGWRIDPSKLPEGATLHLTWAPQRTIWVALLLSGLGFVVCLVLAFRPPREPTRTLVQPLMPIGLSWFDAYGKPASVRATVIATVAAALAGGVFVGLWWSLPTAVAMAWSLRTDLGWKVLRFATIALLGLAAAYVLAKQWRNEFPLGFDWPRHFTAVNSLTMFAYALLSVECATEVLRAGWRRTADLDDT